MPPKKKGGSINDVTLRESATGLSYQPFSLVAPKTDNCYYTSSFIGGKKKTTTKRKTTTKKS